MSLKNYKYAHIYKHPADPTGHSSLTVTAYVPPSPSALCPLTPCQTLIDWEQGMVDSAPILQAPGGPSRQKFLTVFGQHENRIQVERPGTAYPVV